MEAHATQITVDGPFFALSNNIGNQVWGTEFYRMAKGAPGPVERGRPRDRPVRRARLSRRVTPVRGTSAALLVGAVGRRSPPSRVHRSLFPLGAAGRARHDVAVPWWLLRSRRPGTAASFAVGWSRCSPLAVAGRPEGDYVVAADLDGYALLVAGFVLVAVGIVALRGRAAPEHLEFAP